MSSRTRVLVMSISAPVIAFAIVGGFLGRVMAREDTYQHLKIFDDVVSLISSNYVEDADLDKVMRGAAVRGLATFKGDDIPKLILKNYASFNASDKADAVQTLASRPEFALVLLDEVEQGRIPRADISAFVARQLAGLNNKAVSERVAKVWGSVRATSKEKADHMAKYRALLAPDYVKKADLSQGFRRCHGYPCRGFTVHPRDSDANGQ